MIKRSVVEKYVYEIMTYGLMQDIEKEIKDPELREAVQQRLDEEHVKLTNNGYDTDESWLEDDQDIE